MKLFNAILLLTLLLSWGFLWGDSVEVRTADEKASAFAEYNDLSESYRIKESGKLINDLFYLYELEPHGFLIIAGDYRLNPVAAYSFHNDFASEEEQRSLIIDIVTSFLENTLAAQSPIDELSNREKWISRTFRNNDFQQWPPEGTTITGGWLNTSWNQTHPYNTMCPLDPSTNTRSVAGCPSIALAQIVNYHRTVNETRFNESDRYRMFYSGVGDYYIDDAADQLDFPDFGQLNAYLNDIEDIYVSSEEELNSSLTAALIFAGGVAIKQAYGSSSSGNYFDTQNINAYHRFGFNTAVMLNEDAPLVAERIFQNMKQGLPAQISLLTNSGAGHQLVIDGYNTNDQVHLNFGWGGQANGWYNYPLSNMPYGLNIFHTVFLDINQDWEDCPYFELNIVNGSEPRDWNTIQYEISNGSVDVNEYLVFVNGELVATHYTEGLFTLYVSGYENGYHCLEVFAVDNNDRHYVVSLHFEVGRGETVFTEDFDQEWLGVWGVESSIPNYTWQSINNSFISFSNYNPDNQSSATCPIAYASLFERLLSPIISLPESTDIQLLFYAAYSDMYPNFPNVSLCISQDYSTTWEPLWQAESQGSDWRWHRINIDLTPYSGEEVMLRFTASGFSYCDVSIDHIRIYDRSNVGIEKEQLPQLYDLTVYPNPARLRSSSERGSGINIDFVTENPGNVTIELFDIKGRKIDTLIKDRLPAGKHNIIWHGEYANNRIPASGIYFIRVKTDSQQKLTKIILLK